jgi:NAD(P)H-nitrite reductase large subunit
MNNLIKLQDEQQKLRENEFSKRIQAIQKKMDSMGDCHYVDLKAERLKEERKIVKQQEEKEKKMQDEDRNKKEGFKVTNKKINEYLKFQMEEKYEKKMQKKLQKEEKNITKLMQIK